MKSRVTILITHVAGLITLHITTPEPPSNIPHIPTIEGHKDSVNGPSEGPGNPEVKKNKLGWDWGF